MNPDGVIIPDDSIVMVLKKIREQKEFINGGGVKKLRYYLQRDYGFVVNHKKIYRLCKENNLLLPKKKKKKSMSKICINRTVTRPNQLWEVDLKYGYIHGANRFFFILAIIEVFTRFIVNYHIELRCTGKDLVITLKNAMRKYISNESEILVIRSDNGTQMTSKAFMEYV